MSEENNSKNPFVGIGAVIGGVTLAMVYVILLFAKEMAWLIIPVVGFMSLMGMCFAFYTYHMEKLRITKGK